ncbi:Endoplasmic reticulum vesicle protein 25 [Rhodotorula toruloides]|nr:Endoplasmic reticulum vesicle protein 25 [Rhodotorula toruloides]
MRSDNSRSRLDGRTNQRAGAPVQRRRTMTRTRHAAGRTSLLAATLALLVLPSFVSAVKFSLTAHHNPKPKCLWNYAMSDTLVVISVSSPVTGNDLQRLDMEVVDGSSSRNTYQAKRGLKGETRMAITTHADADLGVCFRNVLDPSVPEHQANKYERLIDLDVDIGADAVDYNAIAKQESLSGLEVEMRKLEGVVKEIVDELNYLKRREMRMRDTNESTNARVKNFFYLTFSTLILLGVWQVVHLRSYFKKIPHRLSTSTLPLYVYNPDYLRKKQRPRSFGVVYPLSLPTPVVLQSEHTFASPLAWCIAFERRCVIVAELCLSAQSDFEEEAHASSSRSSLAAHDTASLASTSFFVAAILPLSCILSIALAFVSPPRNRPIPRHLGPLLLRQLARTSLKESWWSEIPVTNALPSDGCDGIRATAEYWLALGSASGSLVVLPYDQHGKFGMKAPTLQTGLRAITAFEVDGFDRFLAVGGDNRQINVFELPPRSAFDPSNPSAQSPTPLLSVAASPASKPVDCIAFHPLADSIFLSTSHTNLAIWDASSQSTSPVFQISMPAQAWSAQWGLDGKHVTATGKDGKLRMWDVRSGSSDPVAEVAIHAGPKATRHAHIPALSPTAAPQILTTGFSRTRDREYSLFDIRSLASGATKTQRIDTGTGVITPLVDESRGIAYLAGKGDMTLRWVEVGGPGGVTEGSASLPVPLLSAALAPPNTLELMKAEINRLVVLAGGGNDAVVPVSITVPRRQYLDFHSDLYPPVSARVPAQAGQEWLSRKDEDTLYLEKRHLDPSKPWVLGEKTRTSAASPAVPIARAATAAPAATSHSTPQPAVQAMALEKPATPSVPGVAAAAPAPATTVPATSAPTSTATMSASPATSASLPTPSAPDSAAAAPAAAFSNLSLNGKSSSPRPTFGSSAAKTSSPSFHPAPEPTAPKSATTPSATPPTRPTATLGDSMKPDAWSRKFLAGKTPLKPDYFDVHDLSSTMGNDVQLLKASSLYFFYPLAGTGGRLAFHPLARKGRLPVHPSCVSIGGTITDFAVDPFDPTRVFVAGDDSSIRVFSLPSDPAEWKEGEVLTEATRTLTDARMDRISELHHHPAAKDLLLSISDDKGNPAARLWNVGSGEMLLRAELPKGGVSSTAWSPDGSLLALATKNKQVHVLDPRAATSTLVSTAGHDSIRPVRVVWASDKHVLSTGFNRAASRELILYDYDGSKLAQVGKASLDISPAPLFPYFDIDTRIALLYSRGDRSCLAYEVNLQPAAPHEAFAKLPHFEHGTLQSGFAFFPKTSNDIKAVEIVRALRLTPSTAEAVSFTVPRAKTEYFQDDIFVPTRDVTKPSMTAEEYLSGANKPLEIVDVRPEGMKLLSEAPAPVKNISTRSKTAQDEAASDEEEVEPVRSKNAIVQDDDEW